jgi:hypothetical protein
MPLQAGRTNGLDGDRALNGVLEKLQEIPSWSSIVINLNDSGHWEPRGSTMPLVVPFPSPGAYGQDQTRESESRMEGALEMAGTAIQNFDVRAYRLKGEEVSRLVFPWTDIEDESEGSEARIDTTSGWI